MNVNPQDMKVSVCIVTYNHEAYIRETLDSVLMQDFDEPYEIIVGDDGSTDRTPDILKEYAARHPERFHLILHKENRGPRANVRSVRARLTGEYVAVLDGDDFWTETDKLRTQIEFLDAHREFSAAACRYRSVVARAEDLHGPPVSPEQPEIIDMETYLSGVWIGASGFVYRRSMVPEFPEWVWELNCGDKGLQFLCAEQGPIRFFNRVMSAYRIHDGGMYSGINSERRLGWMIEYLTVFDQRLNGAYSHILHPRIASKYYLRAFLNDERQDWEASRRAIRQARRYEPSKSKVLREEAKHLVRRLPPLHQGLRFLKRHIKGQPETAAA